VMPSPTWPTPKPSFELMGSIRGMTVMVAPGPRNDKGPTGSRSDAFWTGR